MYSTRLDLLYPQNQDLIILNHAHNQSNRSNKDSNLLLKRSKELRRGLLAVTLGVVLSPAPEILASLLEGTLSLPAELSVGAGRVGSEVQDITSATGSNLVGLVRPTAAEKARIIS